MSSEWVVWFFEGITVAAAFSILFSNSIFHAGLSLLIVVISLGVIFGLYGSEFLFISQILVYGGGIIVLILFATVVTSRDVLPKERRLPLPIPLLIFAAGIITLISVWVMAYQPRGVPYVISTVSLGNKLLLDYSLPLEISGILLLVSLVGSAITATQKPSEP